MRRFQIVYGHSRVDLGRFQRLVAQQLLNVPDRGAVLPHVGGAGVPKGMGADVLFNTGTGRMAFDRRPELGPIRKWADPTRQANRVRRKVSSGFGILVSVVDIVQPGL
jgi:hypothetical protein